MPDQDRQVPLRQWKISFNQGAECKALISIYIGIIPPSGDPPAAEHKASTAPPPRTPVSSAMTAKIGAAARWRKSAAPIAASLAFAVEPFPFRLNRNGALAS